MTDKAAERTQLVLTLGRLLAPLHVLASATTPPAPQEYQVAAARLNVDLQNWRPAVRQFATVGGVEFGHELDDILRLISGLPGAIADLARNKPTPESRQARLREILPDVERLVIERIDRVPIEWAAQLLAERTPFAAHLRIRDAIRTARHAVHFFDRYLDPSVFDLYLRDLDRSTEVRLVSTRGGVDFGTKALEAAGRLAAQEFRDFQIIECQPASMHDRNLRVDELIFFLGPSLKDVGRYPTNFAPAASTLEAHRVLDTLLSGGRRIV